MKNFNLTAFVILNCIYLNAQITKHDTISYEIIYDFTFQINKSDSLNINSEKMILNIGKKNSEFMSYNRLLINDIKANMEKTGIMDMRNVPKSKFKYSILKDYNNNELLYFNSFGVTKLYYADSLNNFNWKLENQEKDIQGYKCKKATTNFAGRDYVAWFSEDIPISEGPYKFNGLPGLIMEIYDTQDHYHFTLIGLKKMDKESLIKYDKFIKVTQDEFNEYEAKIKDKPSLMAKSDMISFSKEMLDKIDLNGRKKFAYENNPIELTDE